MELRTFGRVESFTWKPEHLKLLEMFNIMTVKSPAVFQWLFTHHLAIILSSLATQPIFKLFLMTEFSIHKSVGRYFRTLQQIPVVFSALLYSLLTEEIVLNSLQ